MPDRLAGLVIRRARSARFLTFDHHRAASVSPSAVSLPSPYPLYHQPRCAGKEAPFPPPIALPKTTPAFDQRPTPQHARRRSAGA
ncbi:uncharacterized protein SCHCODRAFT_01359127 [Schizophyllum commune H4-8]|uniref:uncharacterized protein n=1 Tax=Schizophyllum commune (strain H4-8 / FGSC 9210) TaxID=578458 RepID=UPI00215F0F24|nr:uncharacterized protein SCHCODRAFT_01359127 [Schizophyllum commune H4-8]KAI5888431.1 hypothetical protein SCHCODRAFT_01359127 [Schizophyllum commune H4-8]